MLNFFGPPDLLLARLGPWQFPLAMQSRATDARVVAHRARALFLSLSNTHYLSVTICLSYSPRQTHWHTPPPFHQSVCQSIGLFPALPPPPAHSHLLKPTQTRAGGGQPGGGGSPWRRGGGPGGRGSRRRSSAPRCASRAAMMAGGVSRAGFSGTAVIASLKRVCCAR
jgi:hypothetical protein